MQKDFVLKIIIFTILNIMDHHKKVIIDLTEYCNVEISYLDITDLIHDFKRIEPRAFGSIGSFKSLESLTRVVITDTLIESLEKEHFYGLENLKELILEKII